MRTTLNIDQDVLAVARGLAAQRRESVGKVLSDLARQALTIRPRTTPRNSVPLLPVKKDAQSVTMEMVNTLRDGDGES